jgi:energy-coupling factor transport system substrate-specific component
MENTRKFIGLKDIILVTLLTAICIVICTVAVLPFASNLLLVLLLVPFLELLLCGPVYMLAVAKAPRIGTHFLFAFLFSIYYLITNGMPVISLIILGVGLISELLLLNGGYRKTGRIATAFSLFGVSVMMAPVTLMLISRTSLEATMIENGLPQEYIDSVFAVYSGTNICIGALLAIVGAVAGCLIGRKLLKKHFMPAGIVG